MVESKEKDLSQDAERDPKLSLNSYYIKKAIWHEGKDAEEKAKMQRIMRKFTQGEELTSDESADYRAAYRRIYSRRYRRLNRNKLGDYHKRYRKTHLEAIREQQRTYRNNPNNGYQAYITKYRKSKKGKDASKRSYRRKVAKDPDRMRQISAKNFKKYYDLHPDKVRENTLRWRKRKAQGQVRN